MQVHYLCRNTLSMKTLYSLYLLLLLPTANLFSQGTWVQKANVPPSARNEATGFSIGTKGYVTLGSTTGLALDIWEYDPSLDSWTQGAVFTGPGRNSPVSFSIGNKGYVGTGGNYNDFWEYDPLTNAWTALTNCGGV